jgi:hypothetical protein
LVPKKEEREVLKEAYGCLIEFVSEEQEVLDDDEYFNENQIYDEEIKLLKAIDWDLYQNTVFETFDLVYNMIKKRAAEIVVTAPMEKFILNLREVVYRILKQSLNVPEMYLLTHTYKVSGLMEYAFKELSDNINCNRGLFGTNVAWELEFKDHLNTLKEKYIVMVATMLNKDEEKSAFESSSPMLYNTGKQIFNWISELEE